MRVLFYESWLFAKLSLEQTVLPKKQSGGLEEAWDVASPASPERRDELAIGNGLGQGATAYPNIASFKAFRLLNS